MDNILNENFSIVTWPEVQNYMDHPDFYDYAVLINSGKFYDQVGDSAYLVPDYIINETNNSNKVITRLNAFGEYLTYKSPNTILEVKDGDEPHLEKDENNKEFVIRVDR